MSVHKIETVRDSEHRLFALSGEGTGMALAVGRAKPLAEGVTLTLADQAGNAMVEIVAGKRGSAQVTVDGAEVFEIAHCKPGQKIEVDGEAFVVLAPFGIFVQARKRVIEEAPVPASLPVARKVVPKAKKVAPKKKKSPLLLVVAAMVCAAGVGLAMMPGAEEPVTEPVKTAVAKPAPKKKVAQAPTPKAPAPELAQTPEPEVAKPEPQVAKVEAPAPAPSKPSQVATPTPDKRPKAPKVKTAAATEKPAASKSLPPEREAAVRKQIESYQLEAGFDPDAAAAKLRKLKAELPADAAIRGEVDKALKGLPQ